ncbi:MAG: DUF5112 domain-containing protein [Bacteroidales bacterium]|nr:DUF5112 domain-containing protein [Bacteroidales bacterium]
MKVSVFVGFLVTWLLCVACGAPTETTEVALLNVQSYALRYKDNAASEAAAHKALLLSGGNSAQACNNLAASAFINMDFDLAATYYDKVYAIPANPVEYLVADIGMMKISQRTSSNKEFYDYRTSALRRMESLRSTHSPRFRFACSEFFITSAVYYYYLQQTDKAVEAMEQVSVDDVLAADTAQWLYYDYMLGSGGLCQAPTRRQVVLKEFDYLVECLQLAQRGGFVYFEANSSQALADLLKMPSNYQVLLNERKAVMRFLNPDDLDSSALILHYAHHAIQLFMKFGDDYQTAGSYRTLAECYNELGDHEEALKNLYVALQYLGRDAELKVPESVARIREQLSVTYALLGQKVESDANRNHYLDLLDYTRQDKELESRYAALQASSRHLDVLYACTIGGVILLFLLFLWINRHIHAYQGGRQEQLSKEQYIRCLHLAENKRQNMLRKTCVSIVTGMIPFIDRLVSELDKFQQSGSVNSGFRVHERLQYMAELLACINEHNDILSLWIKMRQGQVSLKVENFVLEELFEMVQKSKKTFENKHLTLQIEPTDAVVKADKSLTLFMINTLMDNARKFTPTGGTVRLFTQSDAESVTIVIADNGNGLSPEDVKHILDAKVYEGRHGFGIMNCKGIIEKYRKTNPIFCVCDFRVESTKGEGSRFMFRLPKGVLGVIMAFVFVLTGCVSSPIADASSMPADTLLVQANRYAELVYANNVSGRHAEALLFADSALASLNHYVSEHYPEEPQMLRLTDEDNAAELTWWQKGYYVDYYALLDVRNEAAVAFLALADIPSYRYNNQAYTVLFKQISADKSIENYCTSLQHSSFVRQCLAFLCLSALLLWLSVVAVKAWRANRVRRLRLESMADESQRMSYENNRLHVQNLVLDNCLSTIKHETIYYPNKISQIASTLNPDVESTELRQRVADMAELVVYYRGVFDILSRCAVRQLDEATFRRSFLSSTQLSAIVERVAKRLSAKRGRECQVDIQVQKLGVCVDEVLFQLLVDNVLGEAMNTSHDDQPLRLAFRITPDSDVRFTRFEFIYYGRHCSSDELNQLFYPHLDGMRVLPDGELRGIEFLVCRQIIREHDEYAGRRGCRINAEPTDEGMKLWFTLPKSICETNSKTKKNEI